MGLLHSVALGGLALAAAVHAAEPPQRLHDTGLYADALGERLAAGVTAFVPSYPLWSDGTKKRRWIQLPPGSSIDASDPDAWQFPRGTRLWKEFAYGGRVETRFMSLGSDGQWTFATYVWNAEGSNATLAPPRGIRQLPVTDAPDGRYAIPSRNDCLICHAGARAPVLGFSALQLGDALPALMRSGVLREAPGAWRDTPPRIAATSDVVRAARGHLHANCGHCHHENGAPVPLLLAQRVGGSPAPSVASLHTTLRRMATRDPLQQMPPLGTRVVDADGLAKVQAWLDEQSATTLISSPPHERKEP